MSEVCILWFVVCFGRFEILVACEHSRLSSAVVVRSVFVRFASAETENGRYILVPRACGRMTSTWQAQCMSYHLLSRTVAKANFKVESLSLLVTQKTGVNSRSKYYNGMLVPVRTSFDLRRRREKTYNVST